MPERPGLRSLLGILGRRRPKTRGLIRISGIRADVTIGRDRWGIPHIDAQTDADAWFGLGFCHGQDRAFQLELLVRAGRGTLSELVGSSTVPIDRLSRTLGFRRLATAQRPMLDADIVSALGGYVAGVNAAATVTPRPHELVLLRAQRSSWEVEDVLAFLALQSLALNGNWDAELARLRILLDDGPDALRSVDPTYGPWLPVVAPVGTAIGPGIDRLAVDLAQLRGLVGGGGGSNAWAISGARTASGVPLLANDPHLAPGIPCPWYLAHVGTPDWAVAGASFVGGPSFPTGHNGHVAWGITAGCTDSSDLFWEEVDDATRTVRGPDGPEPLVRISETIAIRGAPTLTEDVLVTPRGPIVTRVLDNVDMALSLAATWLRPGPVRGLLDVQRAHDFPSFREAFAAWPGPALNVAYADREGHVGWQLTGSLPVRGAGHGTLPAPAWGLGWEPEAVPFAAMPFVIDPPTGFVATANNAPRADALDAPFLGVDWLDGYRAARILEVLAGRSDWDVEACAVLQLDVTSVPWREIRETLLSATPTDADGKKALELLRGWDGIVDAGSAGASVFELTVAGVASAIARSTAPRSWRWALGAGFGGSLPRTSFGARAMSHLVGAMRADDGTADIAAALSAAVATLRSRFGDDPAAWAWGRIRPLRLMHPLGIRAPLDRLNIGPVPHGGDSNTVAQAGVSPLDPLRNPAAIPNHRTVIDLGDLDRSRYVLAGGQSGNPLSPHYADLFALWRRGEAVPIAWSSEAVAAATVDSLRLRPDA
jgi:penicillin amidase